MSGFLGGLFTVVCIISYICNFIWLCQETVVGMALARAMGIILFPIGIILGFI